MIIVMTLVFGVYSLEDHGLFVEILWIFSTYLESISMLPQQPVTNWWHCQKPNKSAKCCGDCVLPRALEIGVSKVHLLLQASRLIWFVWLQHCFLHFGFCQCPERTAGTWTTSARWFPPMFLQWVAIRWCLESVGAIISSSDHMTLMWAVWYLAYLVLSRSQETLTNLFKWFTDSQYSAGIPSNMLIQCVAERSSFVTIWHSAWWEPLCWSTPERRGSFASTAYNPTLFQNKLQQPRL